MTSIEKVWNETQQFPVITICNVNNMAKSKVKEHFPGLYMYLSGEVSGARETLLNGSDNITNNLGNQSNYNSRKAALALPLVEILEKTMVPIDDMFLQCRWQNFVIPCRQYIKPLLTDLSFCYSLQNEKILTVVQPGPDFGLSLTIDINRNEYLLTPTSLGAGVFVLIHDKDVYPIMKQRSLSLAPGFEHYLSIEREETIRIKKPYASTNCEDTEAKEKHGKGVYSYEKCLAKCALNTVYGPCKCQPFSYDPSVACTIVDHISCAKMNKSRIYESNCNCPPACKDIKYEVQPTSLQFPSDIGLQELDIGNVSVKSSKDLSKDVFVVKIYFRGMEYTVIEQKVSMTTGQLIADIGGQLGLFLGASLITVVEFMEFATLGVWYCLTGRGKLKQKKDPV